MKFLFRFVLPLLLILPGCEDDAGLKNLAPTVLLISMDGFRWDYMERTNTPNLDYLVEHGVKAEALIPVFLTKTFPNHLTIVTGLYPENHGIVSNNMYDPEFDDWYYIGQGSEPVQDGRWYDGEPIWVTAAKQNQIAMTMFWPASEAEIMGLRPDEYYIYDGSIPNEDRVEQVLDWLDYPQKKRPTFLTVYFSDLDSWGHAYGPESTEMKSAIVEMDDRIGQLLEGLQKREMDDKVNIIITSDHGMVQLSRDQIIFLDDYISLDDATIVDWSPVTAIRPDEGKADLIYDTLKDVHENFHVYKKEEMPEHLHYREHRRIPSIIGISDEGWSVTTHDQFDSQPNWYTGGGHGYDPAYKSMHGIFIAHGPAFKEGEMIEAFQNLHLYELMCHVLGLIPAENDGKLDSVLIVLRD